MAQLPFELEKDENFDSVQLLENAGSSAHSTAYVAEEDIRVGEEALYEEKVGDMPFSHRYHRVYIPHSAVHACSERNNNPSVHWPLGPAYSSHGTPDVGSTRDTATQHYRVGGVELVHVSTSMSDHALIGSRLKATRECESRVADHNPSLVEIPGLIEHQHLDSFPKY